MKSLLILVLCCFFVSIVHSQDLWPKRMISAGIAVNGDLSSRENDSRSNGGVSANIAFGKFVRNNFWAVNFENRTNLYRDKESNGITEIESSTKDYDFSLGPIYRKYKNINGKFWYYYQLGVFVNYRSFTNTYEFIFDQTPQVNKTQNISTGIQLNSGIGIAYRLSNHWMIELNPINAGFESGKTKNKTESGANTNENDENYTRFYLNGLTRGLGVSINYLF